MTRKNIIATMVATLTSAMVSSTSFEAWGRSVALDLRKPMAESVAPSRAMNAAVYGEVDNGVLRSFDLDAGAADVGEVATGDELAFTLFDDVTVTLTLGEQMPTPLGGDAFLAEASGYDGVKNAVVLRTAHGLTVDVHDFRRNKIYKVVSTESGVAVKEVEAGGGACGCDSLPPPKRDAGPARSASVAALSASGPVALRSESGDVFVDILVAYDKNAAAWAMSNGGGVTNFAQTAVQNMNAAIANTGLDKSFKFRLVGILTLSVHSSDLGGALDDVTYGTGGWAPVKAKRDEVGADVVTILVDTGSAYGTTGMGWSLEDTDFAGFSEYAYNACAIRSVAQSHTMTHEVGHNMGCGHSDIQRSSPGPQLYDYSAGYYFTADGEAYHTIMAYGTEGPGGEEVPYFSSPDYAYKGVAVGDARRDNTRTLANTFAAVSKWRAEAGGEIGGGDDPVSTNTAEFDHDAMFAPVSGCESSVDVWSSGEWSVAEHSDWIVPHVLSGGDGMTTLYFAVAANETGYERTGSLTVRPKGSSYAATLLVRQNTVDFATTMEEAEAAARLADRRILLVMGREECWNTQSTLFSSVPSSTVRPLLDAGYVIWYSNCDRQTDAYRYSMGLGSYTLPLVCIIDPLHMSTYVARVTGYQGADDLKAFLEANPPIEPSSGAALPGLKPASEVYGPVFCGVAFDPKLVDSTPADGWAVTASGLPAGLKYDAWSGRISGVPTKVGTFTVAFTATKQGEEMQTAAITLRVNALPEWATGTFAGNVAWNEGRDEEFGAASMTVAANGKISGKILRMGAKWSFTASNYAAMGCEGSLFIVDAVAKSGKFTMPVSLEVCGAVSPDGILENAAVSGTAGDCEAMLWRNIWKDKSTAAVAKMELLKWEGLYTLSLDDGGYLSLTVGKDGNVKASGKLSDGTKVSATSPLMYDEDYGWLAYFYTAPSAYKGGSFAIAVGFNGPRGELEMLDFMDSARWISRNPQATGEYGEGFVRTRGFSGAYYGKKPDVSAWSVAAFCVEPPDGYRFDGRAPKISLAQATGIFKGSYSLLPDYGGKAKKVNFEGIVVLGAESLRGFYPWDAVGSYVDPKSGRAKTYKYKEPRPMALEH